MEHNKVLEFVSVVEDAKERLHNRIRSQTYAVIIDGLNGKEVVIRTLKNTRDALDLAYMLLDDMTNVAKLDTRSEQRLAMI